MNRSITAILILHLIISLFIVHSEIQSQEVKTAKFNYISPVPGSKYIMPQNNIALRHGDPIQVESLQNFSIHVTGTESGRITGRIVLSDDLRTVIFKPDNPFAFGEEVQVVVFGELKTKTGLLLERVDFSFSVTPAIPDLPADYFFKKESTFDNSLGEATQKNSSNKSFFGKNNNLPEDFPEIIVNLSDNLPPEGYYFVATFSLWGWYPDAVPYLIIMDEYGTPVFYRKITAQAYDFKKLYNGNMVYYANYSGWYRWVIEDDAYMHVDDWAVMNGYWTDWHEFLLLSEENHEGHAFVMAYDPQIVDMSHIVPGGHPNAIVLGWVIQELDINKNVVFQWRSWDHYLLTDASDHVDLTDSIIDPIHGNAIGLYSNDALLLSPRNLDEITKIDWNTGDIIWRLGGENNMFEFVNDTLGFSVQHDCRRLENGNISLFDNGAYHSYQFSSTVEYELDEENFTATLIRRFRHEPDAFGSVMGNGQETEAGNIVTGWGSSGNPAITEFDLNGEILAEINIESINYRAYRYPWETSYFSLDSDTVNFGYIYYEHEVTKSLKIQNNMDHDIEITSFYSLDDAFSIPIDLPIIIQAGNSKYIPVKFAPATPGNYQSIITINSDINTLQLVQRIAQQVYVEGYASENQNIADYQPIYANIYPNPVTENLLIEFQENHSVINIKIIDSQSRIIYTSKVNGELNHTVNMKYYATGVYYLQVEEKTKNKFGHYKIIKQ
ncbi:MAG: aryl-sulfate sulfotransferase [Bacteroidales bacterium]|nr:aryl-sulfate sulfotransferase [Bacteroidales bacterium]